MEKKYEGIDFGFASNSGKTILQALASYAANNIAASSPAQASSYFKELIQNEAYKKGLNKDYQSWLDSVAKQENIQASKVVNVLGDKIIDYFEQNKTPLSSAAVNIEDGVVRKLLKNKNIAANMLENLIDDLLNSTAILFDKTANTLAVILPVKDKSNKLVKVVIKLAKDTNNIIAIDKIDPKDLKDSNLKIVQSSK